MPIEMIVEQEKKEISAALLVNAYDKSREEIALVGGLMKGCCATTTRQKPRACRSFRPLHSRAVVSAKL